MRKVVSMGMVLMLSVAYPVSQAAAAQSASGATLTGSAVSTDLQPVPSATVRLRSTDNATVIGSTTTTETGQYSFSGVLPGDYVLELTDASGRLVGVTAPFSVKDAAPLTVSIVAGSSGVMATAAAASTGTGFSFLGLGSTTSMAILGAAGAAAVTAVVATRSDASPSR